MQRLPDGKENDMKGQKKGGIAEWILAVTVVLAIIKLFGIVPIRWSTVFAPIRIGIMAVILLLLAVWIMDDWGRR